MSLDDEVMRALIHQVSKAVPAGGNESNVLTLITRPMWEMWCRAVNIPTNSPTISQEGLVLHRIYGSFTIVVESPAFEAGSTAFQ